jgi:hypothetical protein
MVHAHVAQTETRSPRPPRTAPGTQYHARTRTHVATIGINNQVFMTTVFMIHRSGKRGSNKCVRNRL